MEHEDTARPTSSRPASAQARDLAAPELLALCTEELDLKSAVLDGLADGIVVHTIEGDLLYSNPAAAVVYGFGHDEFARLGRYEWVPPELRADSRRENRGPSGDRRTRLPVDEA